MRELLHVISSSLHILAAVTWIGSMIYSQYAVAPALKHLGTPRSHAINMIATGRFSILTWTSLIILVLTGSFAVSDNVDKLTPLLSQPAGIVLFLKLLLVAALIIILLYQIYALGPAMKKFISPATPKNQENTLAMNKTSRTVGFWSHTHLLIQLTIFNNAFKSAS